MLNDRLRAERGFGDQRSWRDRNPVVSKNSAEGLAVTYGHVEDPAAVAVAQHDSRGGALGSSAPRIEYLRDENRVLKEHLGGSQLRRSNDQRRWLAAKAKALGRKALAEICTIVTPDTICVGTGS